MYLSRIKNPTQTRKFMFSCFRGTFKVEIGADKKILLWPLEKLVVKKCELCSCVHTYVLLYVSFDEYRLLYVMCNGKTAIVYIELARIFNYRVH